MKSSTANVVILAVVWALCASAGAYFTFFQQPRTLAQLEEAERTAALKRDEAGALTVQQASSEGTAREVMLKWNARYKVMPESLRAHESVAYLNSLTRSGFKTFDVKVTGTQTASDYSFHTIDVTGRALYRSLYDFVWAMENHRSFYRVASMNLEQIDLVDEDSKGRAHLEVMVSFTMTLHAYFGGAEGVSAPPPGVLATGAMQQALAANGPPDVPANVLPARSIPRNPFYPYILDNPPPNTYGLLEIENAELIAIADGRAIFKDGTGYHTLGVGGEVYLGEIVRIDSQRGRVVARLNKGGILDEVERRIDGGDAYRPLTPEGARAANGIEAVPTPR